MGVSAKVICDSSFGETRLITLEVELHRFVLAENNTHKAQSRNIQSSRAIPILKQLEQIANDPAMPIYYGKDQAGMIAGDELEGRDLELVKMIILGMRDACLNGVKQLQKLGLHKQISNRYVEPWMWTKGVVTATYRDWRAMFKLRRHYAAQPEIKALFDCIHEAIEASETNWLKEGEWHLPYVKHTKDCLGNMMYLNGNLPEFSCKTQIIPTFSNVEDAIKVSTSCVAQVSYRKLDDSLDKAIKIYDMLNLPKDGVYPDDPPHFSPTEHVAMATMRFADKHLSGNFNTLDFIQYRKLLENGIESRYLK
jgi:hypothetical protein